MTAHVTLVPSGRMFEVEADETILEAALRQGISIGYSCNNGTCGECRARIVDGQPGATLPHDFVLREAEKMQGTVLLCATRAATDLVIEAQEAGRPEDMPLQTVGTTVYRLHRPRDDVMLVDLRTPRSQTLRFLAGQHACIRLSEELARNKSIASCPCNGRYVQIHVRRVPGDPFSEFVFDHLQLRDKVEIEGPFGHFVLDEQTRRPLVFIAYETGFAPIKSLIEHAISLDWPEALRLYWLGRHAEDHYLLNYCRSWRDALDDFDYRALTMTASPAADDASARAQSLREAARHVVREISELGRADIYLSGPGHITHEAERLLRQAGASSERLHVDRIERF